MSNTDLEVKKSQGLFRVESNRNWQRITCNAQLGGMLFCDLFVCVIFNVQLSLLFNCSANIIYLLFF